MEFFSWCTISSLTCMHSGGETSANLLSSLSSPLHGTFLSLVLHPVNSRLLALHGFPHLYSWTLLPWAMAYKLSEGIKLGQLYNSFCLFSVTQGPLFSLPHAHCLQNHCLRIYPVFKLFQVGSCIHNLSLHIISYRCKCKCKCFTLSFDCSYLF